MSHMFPFFVVGTTQEAARVEEEGHEAIAASGSDAADIALKESLGNGSTAILVMGDDASQEWAEAFEAAGVPYVALTKGEHDRFAEAFVSEGAELGDLLRSYYLEAAEDAEAARSEVTTRWLRKSHVWDVTALATDIASGEVDRQHIPTGLANLDAAIGGGLPEGGLTVLGAGSSSGKTTLMNQIGDNIAASGIPVLFVTCEQSRYELVAKSLSRMMRQTPKPSGGYHVASADHIMSAARRSEWGEAKRNAFLGCCGRYANVVAPHMHVMEMEGQPTVEDIRRAMFAVAKADHPSYSGRDRKDGEGYAPNPVLIVDYLQLLRSPDDRMTDRKAIDVNVMGLRQLAREMATAVVVISSINRASYNEGADMAAFKESGAIEFSSDLALMLQPRGWSERVKAKSDKDARDKSREAMSEYKDKTIRQAEVVVLKNRGGAVPKDPVPLMYDAMCNLFTEDADAEPSKAKKVL